MPNRDGFNEHDKTRIQTKILRNINKKLGLIQSDIRQTKTELHKMSIQLDALEAQVKANADVEESAIVLINGLAAQIVALKDDTAQLQALADSIKAESDKLSAAVVANTLIAPVTPTT